MKNFLLALPLLTLLGGCSSDDLVAAVQKGCGFNIAITDAANLLAGQNPTVQTINAIAGLVCKSALGIPPQTVVTARMARRAVAARPSGPRTIVVNGRIIHGSF